MRLFRIAVCLIFFALSSAFAFAWGPISHMTVAYVAYQHLNPTVKARVRDLLKLNPAPGLLDKVVADLIGAGAAGACVNLGGDLRVAGRAPEGGDSTIAIEDPWSCDAVVDVGIRDGAVATSSTQRRRWTLDGVPRHHLIDPATGEPSTSDLVAVTVIAGAGWTAEVLAKAALLPRYRSLDRRPARRSRRSCGRPRRRGAGHAGPRPLHARHRRRGRESFAVSRDATRPPTARPSTARQRRRRHRWSHRPLTGQPFMGPRRR